MKANTLPIRLMLNKKLVLLLVSTMFSSILPAENQLPDTMVYRTGRWFQYVPYGHSLYADVHPDFVRMDVSATSYSTATNYGNPNNKYGGHMFAVFGGRISIWSMDFQQRRFGLNISQTFNAQLWMDIFERTTAPIINTDYRVGIPTLTFIHRFEQSGREPVPSSVKGSFLKNYSIQVCPFKHESTHIGDELVLQRADKGYALRRVNVSYNYAEMLLTLNEPENRYIETHTFRLGAFVLLRPQEGWYFVNSSDGAVNNLYTNNTTHLNQAGQSERYGPSGMPFEIWLQYQYQSVCSRLGFQALVSAEIRNRAMYNYSLTETAVSPLPRYGTADNRRFTYSIFAGARYNMPHYDGYFSRLAFGIRAYHGNCPYGMFRSEDNFSYIGFSIVYQ